jgi:sec-independent protein translocase protein TatA
VGADLGEAIKGFRKSINNGEGDKPVEKPIQGQTINAEMLTSEEPVKR